VKSYRKRPFDRLRKVLVAGFCILHVSALVWWLTPANGYPKDNRTAVMPAWFANLEQKSFDWKKGSFGTPWALGLERYVFFTASWQSWWLFAPNPMNVHDWITVKAVVGWKDPDPSLPADQRKPGVWGDARTPIYDTHPLWTSYEGDLAARMKGTAGAYFHDPKLVENLASGNWDKPLASFAEYWGKVYRAENGKKPLGIHVIVTRGHIPTAFSGRMPASDEAAERVLWYLHY
jgi:hypothetical protein